MRGLTVSGMRLACHREILSHPPENICSTATAEPVVHGKQLKISIRTLINIPGIEKRSHARR